MTGVNVKAGFAEPVHDSQEIFRIVLAALSRPGTVHPIAGIQTAPPPLGPAAAAVLLTLADYETPVWLSPRLCTDDVRSFVRFHTGAPLAGEPGDAAFVMVASPSQMPDPDLINIGDDEYPDRSSTVIMQVTGFNTDCTLTGPGIDSRIQFGARDLDDRFWSLVRDNAALYPLGVDFLFAARTGLAGLPRSTRIEA